jgi:hypothetical protein
MVAVAAPTHTRLSPAQFCERLLSAVSADGRSDPRERAQQAVLLRPYVNDAVDPQSFESSLEHFQARSSYLADTAREVLTLWRLCSR